MGPLKMNKIKTLALLAGIFLSVGQAQASLTDTVQASTGYFVPTDSQKYDSPYYRWNGQDWSWTHNAIAGTLSNVGLSISAFDVDASSGEVDKIYAMDSGSWVYLGNLQGGNDIWAFSNFNLGASFYDDIAAGLQVKLEIDAGNDGWAVTLAKSSLTVDGGSLPTPIPSVPEPESYAMMLVGLAGAVVAARRRKQK